MAILRLDGVLSRTGHRSHATIYNHIKAGLFTRPVLIGVRSVGWPDNEVDAINAARIAGADDHTLCELVDRLHAQRAIKFERLTGATVVDPTTAQFQADNVRKLRGG